MDTQSVGVNTVTAKAQDATAATAPARGATKDVAPKKPTSASAADDAQSGGGRDPRSLQFQVDGSSRQIVATIVDESNKTVIVQIPDAEALRIAKAIDRMQGFLVDQKA